MQLLPKCKAVLTSVMASTAEVIGVELHEKKTEVDVSKTWPYMTVASLSESLWPKLTVVIVIWSVGYLNWSIGWLIPPLLLIVLMSERQRDANLRRLVAQATALADEKLNIENRIDELPSWVYFPTYDRAEWLNTMLHKVWPNINMFVEKWLDKSLKKKVIKLMAKYRKRLPGLGKDFRFDKISLGPIPPKIKGVKVYSENIRKNEIVLDVDIMYAGNCDIEFRMSRFKGGIKDFQMRGILRVILKPLIPIKPIVGGVQIYFLKCPLIDFQIVYLSDMLELLGFRDVIRKTVTKQIVKNIVFPNKVTVPLAKDIPPETLKSPEPEGVLRIHVMEAKNLMKKDFNLLSEDSSDPYAIVTIGNQEFRSKTIDRCVNPQWDFWCECIVEDKLGICGKVIVDVYDQDGSGSDDFLGRATVDMNVVKKNGKYDKWVTLELAKHGTIHLRLGWLSLSSRSSDLSIALKETQELRDISMSTAVLILYVASAQDLPCLENGLEPDVYMDVQIANRTMKSRTKKSTCNPIWEQGFVLLVPDPETETLVINFYDKERGTLIGTFIYSLSFLLSVEGMATKEKAYTLQRSGNMSKVVLAMKLRILLHKEPESSLEEEEHRVPKEIERRDSTDSSSDSSLEGHPLKNVKTPGDIDLSVLDSTTAPHDSMKEITLLEHTQSPDSTSSLSCEEINGGIAKLGRILLTLKYSVLSRKLTVVVHKITNLPLSEKEPYYPPDSYVKIYILPNRNKYSKKRTFVVKENRHPTYNEEFDYLLSREDLNDRFLEISACAEKGFRGNKLIGQVVVNLSEMDIAKPETKWYDLLPEIKD